MRIISGRLGGRTIASPHSQRTHPMSDKVRGALFNTLGDIDNLSVLDAFAGSGALGLEAFSRGANPVLLIENDRPAQLTIAENIAALQAEGTVKLVRANCSGWSDNNSGQVFDLVLADPPFDNLQPGTLQKLVRHVRPGGLYVLNWPGKSDPPQLDGLAVIDNKLYGDTRLVFYR